MKRICFYVTNNCEEIVNSLKYELQSNFGKQYEITLTKHVDLNGNEDGAFNIILDINDGIEFYYAYGYLSVYGGKECLEGIGSNESECEIGA